VKKQSSKRTVPLATEKRLTREFLERLLGGQERKLKSMRSVPAKDRPRYLAQDIEYTSHSVSTLKWAIAVSDSRKR